MDKRSCWTCEHRPLCFLKHNVDNALTGNQLLNIDGDDAPGKWIDVFHALGRACMKYKYKREE